jgi:predicted ABC-type ATPase
LWVADPASCVARVRTRVMTGGHGVPEVEIRRRYGSGLLNLQQVLLPRVDVWRITDANVPPESGLRYIAHGGKNLATTIEDPIAWTDMQRATQSAKQLTQPHSSHDA